MAKNSQKREYPISAAISSWLATLPPALLELVVGSAASDVGAELIISKAPKRWVVYEPMVLLPSGSFTSAPWPALLQVLSPEQTQNIWEGILRGISSSYSSSSSSPSPRGGSSAKKASSSLTHLTHLAVNEGIPLRVVTHDENDGNGRKEEEGKEAGKENLLRSPSGLRLVYGDFGPSSSSSSSSALKEDDFAAAFWVSTKQNGIVQTWAPRWTMFSRGNVKEKARVLSFPSSSSCSSSSPCSTSSTSSKSSKSHHHHQQSGVRVPSVPSVESKEGVADRNSNNTNLTTKKKKKPPPHFGNGNNINKYKYAIDLYAGIGYFVFSYARLGFRVLCWELNPWSVEGLRRGAEANGWSVRIVVSPPPRDDHDHDDDDNNNSNNITKNILGGKWGEQIIVFLEDNAAAAGRVRDLRAGTITTTTATPTPTTASTTTTATTATTTTTTTAAGTGAGTGTGAAGGGGGDDNGDDDGGENKSAESRQIDIRHINCGFLPSSEPSWRSAWEMLVGGFRWCRHEQQLAGDGGGGDVGVDVDGDGESNRSNSRENGDGKGKPCSTGGWLHLHENVGAADIERRRFEIQALMDEWGAAEDGVGVGAEVEHVELVKTFAPGVWHCVFDVYVRCIP